MLLQRSAAGSSIELKNFESMGLVTGGKSGKNVEVRLSGSGEMFVQLG